MASGDLNPKGWAPWLSATREERIQADRLRALHPLRSEGSSLRVRDASGRRLTLFSSNDYLGLSEHPRVREAIARAAMEQGMGARGSALICGWSQAHEQLAESLARLKNKPQAILFPSGFAANLSTLEAMAGPDLTIFSDALNHASIIDGIRLARRRGAKLEVYAHADVEQLSQLLEDCPSARKLIVTDSVFSMEGDRAPLAELVALKRRHGAWLMLDEAHATLVYGARGGGLAQAMGLEQDIDLQLGTLSKAFGGQGGFLASSARVCERVLNHGRSFIYSTALPAPIVAGLQAALEVQREQPELQRRLWRMVEEVGAALGMPARSPIFPLLLGSEARALEASESMLSRGFHLTAIRPPTVPEGSCRLRLTLSAGHRDDEVEGLLEALSCVEGA